MEWREIVEGAVAPAKEYEGRVPKLFGIPTGVEGLDDMFYTVVMEKGKAKKVSLGGYPSLAVINITGVPDTGKSLMAEQFAIKQASLGYPVLFVTVESPAPFVIQGLKQRAMAMGVEWEKVDENVIMVDAASYSSLRDNIDLLLDTLAHGIRTYDTKSVVIDSITGFFEAREVMARAVVRRIFNFLKKWKQTGLLVSQKRSGHEELSAEAAGGYAVSHIVDATIVLGKKVILSRVDQKYYGLPIGSVLRTIRIDGCRLTGHDTRIHVMEITETGLVKVGPPLEEYMKEVRS